MNGQTFIGGKDIYKDFGVIITKGGYNGLLNYNEIKAPVSNDWPEYHGVETDLSAIYLNSRQVTIPFYGTDFNKTEAFLNFLEQAGGGVLSSSFLTKGYQLRISGQDIQKIFRKGERTFNLSFTEDTPQRYTYRPIGYNKKLPGNDILIDNISLKTLGLIYTGSHSEFLRRSEAKENLLRSIETVDGNLYDMPGGYKTNSMEILIPLLFYIKGTPVQRPIPGDFDDDYNNDFNITRWFEMIQRADMSTFIACYESFLGLLTRPGEHTICYKNISKKCYYKSACNFNILSVCPDIAVAFDLILVLTQSEMN